MRLQTKAIAANSIPAAGTPNGRVICGYAVVFPGRYRLSVTIMYDLNANLLNNFVLVVMQARGGPTLPTSVDFFDSGGPGTDAIRFQFPISNPTFPPFSAWYDTGQVDEYWLDLQHGDLVLICQQRADANGGYNAELVVNLATPELAPRPSFDPAVTYEGA